jgi:hypothetical protein
MCQSSGAFLIGCVGGLQDESGLNSKQESSLFQDSGVNDMVDVKEVLKPW